MQSRKNLQGHLEGFALLLLPTTPPIPHCNQGQHAHLSGTHPWQHFIHPIADSSQGSNPLGGHLNAICTLHCICLHNFWPEMYSYIKKMCNACPGCVLSNPGCEKSSELVYHFPIESPFCVLFVDAYKAGNHSSFEGNEAYLISCCGMTSFAVMEPIKHATSQNFVSAIMKIQLQCGLCHTIVLDKDSKFFGAFKEACNLLQLN
jgi:hypothetical protein